jgi:hypothetical protein
MNLAALHLAVAAVVDRTDQVPVNEFTETVLSNFLDSLPVLLDNEPFGYPSSEEALSTDQATLGKHAQVQQARFQISWQIFVALVKYSCHSFRSEIVPQNCMNCT